MFQFIFESNVINYFIKGVMQILNSFLRLMAWGNLGNYNLWFMGYLLNYPPPPHRSLIGKGGRELIKLMQFLITSPPIGEGRGIVMPMSVCLCVCVCVCPCFRKSQPFLNRSLWNLAYILRMGTPWLTNIFRILGQKVKVVGRRKVKNVIWPYLGNEWS